MPPYVATGQRVGIRRPTISDAEEFIAMTQVSQAFHFPWVDPPKTQESFEKYVESRDTETNDGFLICDLSTHAIAGVINVNCIVRGAFQSAYLGYYAHADFAGKGFMAQGMRLVTRFAFDELKLHRVEANIQPENVASLALARACGFRKEGFSPKYLKVFGEWRDHERWALLAERVQRRQFHIQSPIVSPRFFQMNDKPLKYELFKQCPATRARLGRVTTRHGVFDTPAFMPVGTQGTVKGVLPDALAATGSQIILGNTYHLMLRPGEKVVRDLGDLHKFMSWPGPILTDSGGYQVFSLSDVNKIDDAGVTFKSHVDGAMVRLTPERSMEIQNDLGADIIMAFDECPDPCKPVEYQQQAVDRTVRWAEQCIAAHGRPGDQSLFGIVQGGINESLRRQCAEALVAMDFPGYAIGGLAVGEGFEAMKQVLSYTAPMLPEHKPRYLMGVGFPRDIVAAVAEGVDMFDCVMPTRNGRNAYAFTAQGPLRVKNSALRLDTGPIEPGCDCYACRNFTRGAIRHFFFASEMLGPILVSVHNIRFFQRLMADVRQSIREGQFDQFRATDPRCSLGPRDPDVPGGHSTEKEMA